MKKRLNIYCVWLITACIIALLSNHWDTAMWCYNLGKGTVSINFDSPWELSKIALWALDLNIILFAGILFVIIIRNINNSVVFEWMNIRFFRFTAFALFIHFILSSATNMVEIWGIQGGIGDPIDYYALVITLFVLVIAEVFAIGLRLKEEQELTI
ncbi:MULTISPECIES: DUF2975 domain-containing protein [unclassified Parabacteroides]|nr:MULTISPECIES: DUF2975 domain-containing protein [unclassified Parabacteroides]